MGGSLDDRALWLARHVLPHEPMLRAWLQRRIVPGIDVDDVVQETYARLSQIESVEEVRDPRSYMFQAAHSIIVSHVRRSRIVSIQAMAHLDALETPADEPDPEAQALARDELNRLALAIAAMPERIRDVFVMRRVHGLSQREVAGRLGLSESTVEKHMSKGFRHLSALFGRGGKAQPRASSAGEEETDQSNAASE
jgi:RNA polymerase sigma factor (sigma-70 family)